MSAVGHSYPFCEFYEQMTQWCLREHVPLPLAVVVDAETFSRTIKSLGSSARIGNLGSVIVRGAVGNITIYPPNFADLASRDGVATQLRRIADMLDGGRCE